MKATLQLLKNHPVAFVFLLLYTLLRVNILNIGLQFQERIKHRQPDESGIMLGGDGVAYSYFFLVIVEGIFFLISGGFAIGSKTETKFYLWLILIIVIETITVLNIG